MSQLPEAADSFAADLACTSVNEMICCRQASHARPMRVILRASEPRALGVRPKGSQVLRATAVASPRPRALRQLSQTRKLCTEGCKAARL